MQRMSFVFDIFTDKVCVCGQNANLLALKHGATYN